MYKYYIKLINYKNRTVYKLDPSKPNFDLRCIKLKEIIKTGSAILVYKAKDYEYNEIFELKIQTENSTVLLHLELLAFQDLWQYDESLIYLPKLYGYGTVNIDSVTYQALATERLGLSLKTIFINHKKKFSYRTTLKLFELMFDCTKFLHDHRSVHRNIKPSNFHVSFDSTKLYLTDLGYMADYSICYTRQHIKFTVNESHVGTPKYMSLNGHNKYSLSRRDDLESLLYCILYFIKGTLPWKCGNKNDNKFKERKVYYCKKSLTVDELFSGVPVAIKNIFLHVRNLDFTETPNYARIKKTILGEMEANNYVYDENFLKDLMNSCNQK